MKKKAIEIAKKMKEKGIAIKEIVEITGLDEKDIENLNK